MSKLALHDLPLKEYGLEVLIPSSLRGPSKRNMRWRWRLAVLYPDRLCSYCGEREPLTIDHVRPVADGGIDGLSNFVPACEACNGEKNDKSLLMFLWGRAVTQSPKRPRSIHFGNWPAHRVTVVSAPCS